MADLNDRVRNLVTEIYQRSGYIKESHAFANGQIHALLKEQRERYESALWIAGAFVEIYEGHVLDKLRADKMLRELGIRRWPDGSVDEPTAAATRSGDA